MDTVKYRINKEYILIRLKNLKVVMTPDLCIKILING